MKLKYKNDSGRSMMEMLLYLGITVVIGTGIIQTYSEAIQKTNRVKTDNLVSEIIEKVNNYYLGRNFAAKQDDINDIIKKNMGNISLKSPWNGNEVQVGIKPGVKADGNNIPLPDTIKITFNGLSQRDCNIVFNILEQKQAMSINIGSNNKVKNSTTYCNKEGKNKVEGVFKKD